MQDVGVSIFLSKCFAFHDVHSLISFYLPMFIAPAILRLSSSFLAGQMNALETRWQPALFKRKSSQILSAGESLHFSLLYTRFPICFFTQISMCLFIPMYPPTLLHLSNANARSRFCHPYPLPRSHRHFSVPFSLRFLHFSFNQLDIHSFVFFTFLSFFSILIFFRLCCHSFLG